MSSTLTLTSEGLRSLIANELANGTAVIAPARTRGNVVEYRQIDRVEQILLGGPLPRSSLKPFFLPPTEPIFSWRHEGGSVRIDEVSCVTPQRIVLGVRACDSAALEIVDLVMSRDVRDHLWCARREATLVIGQSCTGSDDACFCAALGHDPTRVGRGVDLHLRPEGDGYEVTLTTDRGRQWSGARSAFFEATEGTDGTDHQTTKATIDRGMVRRWLEDSFDSPLWRSVAQRCHGCGVCASVCPTCHCFDIIDEPEGVTRGVRRRNWDTCQSGRFTLHASGHNPRPDQVARFRQRVMHKFAIYPRRFGEVLCTGCGRCTRECPAGMDLEEIVRQIADLA